MKPRPEFLSPRRPWFWAVAILVSLVVAWLSVSFNAYRTETQAIADTSALAKSLVAIIDNRPAAQHFELPNLSVHCSVWTGSLSNIESNLPGFGAQTETVAALYRGLGYAVYHPNGPWTLELIVVARENLLSFNKFHDPQLVRVWLEYPQLKDELTVIAVISFTGSATVFLVLCAIWHIQARRRWQSHSASLQNQQQDQQQQLTEKLQRTSNQLNSLQLMLNSMNEGVIVCDTKGRIKLINPFARNLFELGELDDQQLLDAPLLERIHANDLYLLFEAIIANHNPAEMELTLYRQPPLTLHVGASWIPNPDPDGQGVLFVLADISTLKHLESIRTEFVANVSHELRTPVTSLKGFAETLLDGDLSDQATTRHFLGIIQRQAERLMAIIEDLLTLSRLEQNGGSIQRETCALSGIVGAALEVCQAQAAAKRCQIITDFEDMEISANRHLLEQAIINLVDNAIKYGPEGTTIRIGAQMIAAPKSWRISISDNGPGIPLRDQEHLFERFYRIDKARSRNMGGTGLGLAIVRHIALVHGGSVHLESVSGLGSTFTVEIPDYV